jgi:5-methylcytosine-specific restriction protein A
MKNPKWHRDEIILALDLYFRTEPGHIHARNPEIIELSEILNKLPIHEIRTDVVKFRNPNGVGLKLSNFLSIDPNYSGKGMESYSKLDYEVFMEFVNEKERLSKLAEQIKKTVLDENLNFKLYKIENEEDDEQTSVKEGMVIYKLHKHRERDSFINRKKKNKTLSVLGKLECEVCSFDFNKTYGELGKGFIECHHKKPLSSIESEVITSIEDLALVCSNCHRMLHREIDTLSIEELKKRIKNGS